MDTWPPKKSDDSEQTDGMIHDPIRDHILQDYSELVLLVWS